jgi:hypothetical protein
MKTLQAEPLYGMNKMATEIKTTRKSHSNPQY